MKTLIHTMGLFVVLTAVGFATSAQTARECSIGKICDITGQVNGMSHDIFFWVIIYTINPTEPSFLRCFRSDIICPAAIAEDDIELRGR
jgi:hypothetical protein